MTETKTERFSMVKLTLLAVGMSSALVLTAAADDKEEKKPERPRPPLTEEQKALRKEIVAKYDTNKDGKLDAEERKAISAEDREKLAKTRPAPRPKKEEVN